MEKWNCFQLGVARRVEKGLIVSWGCPRMENLDPYCGLSTVWTARFSGEHRIGAFLWPPQEMRFWFTPMFLFRVGGGGSATLIPDEVLVVGQESHFEDPSRSNTARFILPFLLIMVFSESYVPCVKVKRRRFDGGVFSSGGTNPAPV